MRAASDGTFVHLAWVGDLDGDGEYDFVVDRISAAAPVIDADSRTGQFPWRMDTGPLGQNQDNIEGGATVISNGRWDGLTVYDFDSDGKAEVAVKTANNFVFGDGNTLTHENDRAHDPFEATTAARIERYSLRLLMTTTRGAARAYAEGDQEIGRGFAVERFSELKPQLARAAGELFGVRAAGRALRLRTAHVKLSPEGEVEFELRYALPQEALELELRAEHLAKLPQGFGNTVTVAHEADAAGDAERRKTLALRLLTLDDSSLRLSLPRRGGGLTALASSYGFFWLGALCLAGAIWLTKRRASGAARRRHRAGFALCTRGTRT